MLKEGISPRLVKHLPDILDARRYRRQRVKITVQRFCNDMGQRGFSYARRPPEDERAQVAALDHFPQDAAFSHQVALSYILGQRAGTHALGKRREEGRGGTHNLNGFTKDATAAFKLLPVHVPEVLYGSVAFHFRIGLPVFETTLYHFGN